MSTTRPADDEAATRPRVRAAAPRSLADALRGLPDADLVFLLRERPDLGVPLPPDLTSLAARAATRASVQRVLDGLTSPELQVVEVLAVLPEPVSPAEVSRHWGAPAGQILDRLRAIALVWGAGRALHLVRAARDVVGPHPAGLGPSIADALDRRSPQRLAELVEDLGLPPTGDPQAALELLADHLGRPEALDRLLERAPDGVRTVLDRLTWGPPVGQVSHADRLVRASDAAGPVDWLLAHGLLGVADPGHVVLPREVALALRGGRVHRTVDVTPPALQVTARSARQVSGSAAGAAAEAVRLVEELAGLWGETPASVLRSGGLGVRELRRVGQTLDLDDASTARVVELAYVAGLIADDGEADPHWMPTPAYDIWRTLGTGQRWTMLTTAWLRSTRCPGLVGTRDARDGVRNALGPDLDRAPAPVLRRWMLDQLFDLGPGAAADVESLRALLDWTAPRRAGRSRDAMIGWTLDEAGWLGVTGAGALAAHARPLLGRRPDPAGRHGQAPDPEAGDPDDAADLLDETLPALVDHVLLQADLTAIAPGPLEPALARTMSLVAEVESRGGATVYRFTPTSIRQGLDAGLTGEDLLATLAKHSRTEVPQPLTYLIQDTGRRHGRIRVGAAQSYLRADDEGMLAELLADRRAATLRLRRLAPTVLAAQATPQEVLTVLRGIGLAPAAETPDGDVVLRRPAEHRTAPRARPRVVSPLPPIPPNAALLSAVQALRAADEALAERTRTGEREHRELGPAPELAPMDPAGVLAVLRDAAAGRQTLWIGYADSTGRPSRRMIDPLSIEAGRVSAFDRGAQELRTFSVHRVTGVAPAIVEA
jgi:hypothetical protein